MLQRLLILVGIAPPLSHPTLASKMSKSKCPRVVASSYVSYVTHGIHYTLLYVSTHDTLFIYIYICIYYIILHCTHVYAYRHMCIYSDVFERQSSILQATSKLEDVEATLRDQDGEKQKLQQEVQSSKGESERLRAMLRLGPFCWFCKTAQPL